MPAAYPAAVYSPRTKSNAPGVVYDAAKPTQLFAEDITKEDDEVVAIETELGTNPKGSHASVKARIEALEAAPGVAFEPGTIQLSASDAEVNTEETDYTKVKEIEIGAIGGEITISFQLKAVDGGTAYGRIYKNGVAAGTERSTANSAYQTYSEDISGLVAGDLVQLYIKTAA